MEKQQIFLHLVILFELIINLPRFEKNRINIQQMSDHPFLNPKNNTNTNNVQTNSTDVQQYINQISKILSAYIYGMIYQQILDIKNVINQILTDIKTLPISIQLILILNVMKHIQPMHYIHHILVISQHHIHPQ